MEDKMANQFWTRRKIKSVEALSAILANLKRINNKIVHCHGVFDFLHFGHFLHFEAAKREGDILVVSTTADEFVNRGPGRPVYTHEQRARFIAALECVDFVVINHENNAANLIRKLKPDVYIKGQDYKVSDNDVTGKIIDEKEAVESVGGRIHFTDEPTLSSSHLLNTYFNVYSSEFRELVTELKKVFSEVELAVFLQELKKRGALASLIKAITTVLK